MHSLIALALVGALTAPGFSVAAQDASSPDARSPSPDASPRRQLLVALKTGVVTCNDHAVTPIYSELLTPEIFTGPLRDDADPEVALSFSIRSDGRPRDIRPVTAVAANLPVVVASRSGLIEEQAALSAWRFPAVAVDECRLTITRRIVTMADAPDATLAQLLTSHIDSRWRREITNNLQRPGDDCAERPDILTAVHPDRRRSQPAPGGRTWTVLRWNVGPDGRTTDVQTLASSSDAAFDAESRRAVGDSRFVDGNPRTGCISYFGQTGDPLGDTPGPEPTGDVLRDCPASVRARFQAGRLVYPEAFRSRGIEGWAIVRYDIASWGQVGAVSVLEAQPASAFGDAARQVISSGRATPGFDGAVRCTDRVIFSMPRDGQAPNTD